ncbi:hypothetical protein ES705_03311 [subsurface metagenome]
MAKKTLLYVVFFFIFAPVIRCQDTIEFEDSYLLYGVIIDNDTLLISSIDEVIIFPTPKFKTRREWRRYYRLVRNVKKVYPLAKMAREKYDSVSVHLLTLETEKEQKKYIKQVEAEIMDEYEEDLKGLTITQGRILLKLLDREIGETSYALLKDFKGTFSAFFWQTLARIFGHNLKSEFDAEGKDWLINEIMILIENGQL